MLNKNFKCTRCALWQQHINDNVSQKKKGLDNKSGVSLFSNGKQLLEQKQYFILYYMNQINEVCAWLYTEYLYVAQREVFITEILL